MNNQNRPGNQAPSREGMQEHKQGQSQQRDKNPSNPSRENQKQPGQHSDRDSQHNPQK
jgi:hypothetical protein